MTGEGAWVLDAQGPLTVNFVVNFAGGAHMLASRGIVVSAEQAMLLQGVGSVVNLREAEHRFVRSRDNQHHG